MGNSDIRCWVLAMHYPNLVHFDLPPRSLKPLRQAGGAAELPIVIDDGHGTAPSCVGCIPDTHLLFGGDEFWHYGPREFGGDTVSNERVPFDYVLKNTGCGPTCFQRGDNFYRRSAISPLPKGRPGK